MCWGALCGGAEAPPFWSAPQHFFRNLETLGCADKGPCLGVRCVAKPFTGSASPRTPRRAPPANVQLPRPPNKRPWPPAPAGALGPARLGGLSSSVQRRDVVLRLGTGIGRGRIRSYGDGDLIKKGLAVGSAAWGRSQEVACHVDLVRKLLPKFAFDRS